jgi:hypothetical protein
VGFCITFDASIRPRIGIEIWHTFSGSDDERAARIDAPFGRKADDLTLELRHG